MSRLYSSSLITMGALSMLQKNVLCSHNEIIRHFVHSCCSSIVSIDDQLDIESKFNVSLTFNHVLNVSFGPLSTLQRNVRCSANK